MKLIQFLLFAALYASLQTANACNLPVAPSLLTNKQIDPKLVAQRVMPQEKLRAEEVFSTGTAERSSGAQQSNKSGQE